MTDSDKQLLAEYDYNIISTEIFLKRFSVDLKNDAGFIRREMQTAINSADAEEIGMTLNLVWLSGNMAAYLDMLNELLLDPNHNVHEAIARALQEIASPSSIPYVRKALESNFDFLAYTCSESGVIAKWFSWLLHSIGVPEAIDLMKEYANSADEGISKEMTYRLSKIKD